MIADGRQRKMNVIRQTSAIDEDCRIIANIFFDPLYMGFKELLNILTFADGFQKI